jgi:alanyl-tRNA synthetase
MKEAAVSNQQSAVSENPGSIDFVRIYGASYREVRLIGLERLNAMSDDARRVLLCAGTHAPSTAAIKRISAEERMERKVKRICRKARWSEPTQKAAPSTALREEKKPVVSAAPVVEVRLAGRFRAALPCLEHGRSVERMMELARISA